MIQFLKTEYTDELADSLRITLSIEPMKLGPEPVCDFCGFQQPVVLYASDRMSTGERQQCWRWCACSICDRLVTANDWDGLRNRIADRLSAMLSFVGRREIDHVVRQVFEDFLNYAVKEPK
jgi:hypothetical protein